MKTGNLYTRTSLRNGGRKAGMGILYDNYGDESRPISYRKPVNVRFPNDNVDPAELSGEVIIVQEARKKDGKE